MKRIASFCVDHTKLLPGIYVSRIDGDIITYDIRMVRPNTPPYLTNGELHTIEHLFATFARICRPCDLLWTHGLPDRLLFSSPRCSQAGSRKAHHQNFPADCGLWRWDSRSGTIGVRQLSGARSCRSQTKGKSFSTGDWKLGWNKIKLSRLKLLWNCRFLFSKMNSGNAFLRKHLSGLQNCLICYMIVTICYRIVII